MQIDRESFTDGSGLALLSPRSGLSIGTASAAEPLSAHSGGHVAAAPASAAAAPTAAGKRVVTWLPKAFYSSPSARVFKVRGPKYLTDRCAPLLHCCNDAIQNQATQPLLFWWCPGCDTPLLWSTSTAQLTSDAAWIGVLCSHPSVANAVASSPPAVPRRVKVRSTEAAFSLVGMELMKSHQAVYHVSQYLPIVAFSSEAFLFVLCFTLPFKGSILHLALVFAAARKPRLSADGGGGALTPFERGLAKCAPAASQPCIRRLRPRERCSL